ncbi:hypothetical protein C1H46_043674 [Malus baccata]|uniref:Uncharacterized protein n=1 Tax=Malus baccata TaxID=106549 RepID=A0A540K970_MALBA|nr:hypothetical protein C1H46_043674 [Malus baccata]
MLSKPKEQILVSKLGQKWDIAMAALYPSSDAGKYINGTRLVVDGGEWQTKPAHSPEEAVKQPSRAVERRSRDKPVVVIASASQTGEIQEKNKLDHHTHQKPTNHNPHKNPIILPAVNHHRPENGTDDRAEGQVAENEDEGHPNLPFKELIALLHGGEPVDGLEDGDDAGQVPEGGDVDMDDEEEEEDDNGGEEEEKGVMGIDGEDEEDEEADEDEIVADHEEGDPEESDEEALEDFGDGGEGVGEGDGLGGVEGGGGEDDGGSGEEGEGEEEDEVAELEEEEEGPFVVELGGVGGGGLELVEEGVGEEGMGEDGEGEREN